MIFTLSYMGYTFTSQFRPLWWLAFPVNR